MKELQEKFHGQQSPTSWTPHFHNPIAPYASSCAWNFYFLCLLKWPGSQKISWDDVRQPLCLDHAVITSSQQASLPAHLFTQKVQCLTDAKWLCLSACLPPVKLLGGHPERTPWKWLNVFSEDKGFLSSHSELAVTPWITKCEFSILWKANASQLPPWS